MYPLLKHYRIYKPTNTISKIHPDTENINKKKKTVSDDGFNGDCLEKYKMNRSLNGCVSKNRNLK